jgi:hypothetical protein
VRYANAAGRVGRIDIRHVLNCPADSYLYHSGRIDATLPFDELWQRSQISEAVQAADDAPDFSQRTRASLPTIARWHMPRESWRSLTGPKPRERADLYYALTPRLVTYFCKVFL